MLYLGSETEIDVRRHRECILGRMQMMHLPEMQFPAKL